MITAVFNVNNLWYVVCTYIIRCTPTNVLHVLCDVDVDNKVNEDVFS